MDLIVTTFNDQYYEPVVGLEVLPKDKQYSPHSDYRRCKNMEDYIHMLISYSSLLNYQEERITIDDLVQLRKTNWNHIVENYNYLQELKLKIYDMDYDSLITLFNKSVYFVEGGYGDYLQELIPFKNIRSITYEPSVFKQIVSINLDKKLTPILENDQKKYIIENLKTRIENISNNLIRNDKEIEKYLEHSKQLKKQRTELEKELINVDKNTYKTS